MVKNTLSLYAIIGTQWYQNVQTELCLFVYIIQRHNGVYVLSFLFISLYFKYVYA